MNFGSYKREMFLDYLRQYTINCSRITVLDEVTVTTYRLEIKSLFGTHRKTEKKGKFELFKMSLVEIMMIINIIRYV
jgi:hypothetical protein